MVFTSDEVSMSNLVSSAGVIATDVTGVGTTRQYPAATQYGGDKGIFGFGANAPASPYLSVTNLVSTVGVIATDTTGVGTARYGPAACTFN